jgi:hypothetical protein
VHVGRRLGNAEAADGSIVLRARRTSANPTGRTARRSAASAGVLDSISIREPTYPAAKATATTAASTAGCTAGARGGFSAGMLVLMPFSAATAPLIPQ